MAGGNVWLKTWSQINQKYGGNPNVGKYIGIYFAFGVGSAALGVLQTLILWIFCSIEVSVERDGWMPRHLAIWHPTLTNAVALGQPQAA